MIETCFFDVSMQTKPKPWDGRDIYPRRIEHKLDGRCVTIVKGKTRHWVVERNLASDISEKLQWFKQLSDAIKDMPSMSVVSGELHVDGGLASGVMTAVNNRSSRLMFTPFSIPVWRGDSSFGSSFEDRDAALKSIGMSPPKRCSIIHRMRIKKEDKEELLRYCEENSLEGLVMKTNQRVGWWKLKRVETVDTVVIGTKPGTGKHRGKIGALQVGLFNGTELVEVASVGKGRDDQWRDMSPRDVIGRVVEVSHEGVQAKGMLKFSSFVRWRDDKSPEMCLMSQLDSAKKG